jgi:hypothetical protein
MDVLTKEIGRIRNGLGEGDRRGGGGGEWGLAGGRGKVGGGGEPGNTM